MVIFWIGLFLSGLWVMAYFRQSLLRTSALLAAILFLWTFIACPSVLFLATVWGLFLLVTIPLNVPVLRRAWLSAPVLRVFRSIMPEVSKTEREALEAGSVWWESEFFKGCPDWRRLQNLPKPALREDEQAFINGPVETLCGMLDDWQITEEQHDLPEEVWTYIREQGFFGMIIPKAYGGLAFSALGHSSVVMKIASRSITAAVTVMVPNSLGPAELLLHYGTDEQRSHYLPRLARGEEIPCFALTGPEAGSDAASIPDHGVVCRGDVGGEEVVGIRLNWEKRYITLGPVATILGLAFKLYDPERLLGGDEEIGITLALIPTSTPGIDIGRRHFPLNMAFQNGPNSGRDVFIPMEYIIGGQERVGQGWRMLMESLAAGRSISLPALAAGAGKLATRASVAYARIRKQFKLPIAYFEGVEEVLVRIIGQTYVIDAARTLTAIAVDQGEKPAVASAIVKYQLTERMRELIRDAMDVHGGSGICLGRNNILGRVYQSIPISITVEGANILTRTLIVFGQGAIRCHPYVFKEMMASRNDRGGEQAVRDFDEALFGHIGLVTANIARSLWLGLTRASYLRLPDELGQGFCARYYRNLTRMSVGFALLTDFSLLTLGGSLKRRERLSGRLADILGNLYLATAALKRFADDGQPEADRPLVAWACEDSLYRIQEAMYGLFENLPNRPLAWFAQHLIFPLGRSYALPADTLGHRLVGPFLEPSEARDRLTQGIYIPNEPQDALAKIEAALDLVIDTAPLEKRLREAHSDDGRQSSTVLDPDARLQAAVAAGVINDDEAALLIRTHKAIRAVIDVDDFPQEYWKGERK